MNNILKAGKVASLILRKLKKIITIGIKTKDIALFAENFILQNYPDYKLACKGYQSFPSFLCVSVNDEIVHGVPSDRIVKEGDVIKVDLVIEYNGWYADTAKTYIIGKTNKTTRRLVKTTYNALINAIKQTKPGNTIGDISYAIQSISESKGFSVMREYSGHGIGKDIHLPPKIPCFGNRGEGEKLKEGMILAIEPMLFMNKPDIEIDKDGWTVKSKDKGLTAHFEHTIMITKNKPIIITK